MSEVLCFECQHHMDQRNDVYDVNLSAQLWPTEGYTLDCLILFGESESVWSKLNVIVFHFL
jgi:hypothetical protein